MPAASAQVLARPGWAGSGVTAEAWWLRAVFYRLDPATFQDSNGDGRGDLQGVLDRLDYIQSLGVDALLLDGSLQPSSNRASTPPDNATDLGDLVREASRHQLRVLLRVPSDLPRADLLRTVRDWLGNGAAGLWAPRPATLDTAAYADLLGSLRDLLQHYPGDRVLLSDAAPLSLRLAPAPLRLSRRINPGSFNAVRGGQLVTASIFPENQPTAATLRGSLAAISGDPTPGLNPLLRAEPPLPSDSPDAMAGAALLLASRGAVILDAGQEIGLRLFPAAPPAAAPPAAAAPALPADLPVMQWTPSNHTPAPVEATTPEHRAASTPATEFGAFHPYVPPPRGLPAQGPSAVHVALDPNAAAALPDPDSLAGFTAGTLPVAPRDGVRLNVTTEDRDPRSLLNAYRQLIAAHHGNPTLHNGTERLLDGGNPSTLLWTRRAPAGARIAANILAAVNLGAAPVTLDLDSELDAAGLRGGALRPLFASSPAAETGETTHHLLLPPHGVLVGEIYHAGAAASTATAVAHARHSGRRHRVRR